MTKINTTKTKEANLEQLLANAKTNLTELTNSVTKGVEQANLYEYLFLHFISIFFKLKKFIFFAA